MATFIALSQHFKWKYLWSPSLWYSFVYSKFWFQLASKALILLPAFSMISSLFLNFPYWGSLRHNGKTIMVMESMKQTLLFFCILLWYCCNFRLLAIKVKGGWLSQGFRIPDGLMVNLWFLMGRLVLFNLAHLFNPFAVVILTWNYLYFCANVSDCNMPLLIFAASKSRAGCWICVLGPWVSFFGLLQSA